jgi:hypothetical protein
MSFMGQANWAKMTSPGDKLIALSGPPYQKVKSYGANLSLLKNWVIAYWNKLKRLGFYKRYRLFGLFVIDE